MKEMISTTVSAIMRDSRSMVWNDGRFFACNTVEREELVINDYRSSPDFIIGDDDILIDISRISNISIELYISLDI